MTSEEFAQGVQSHTELNPDIWGENRQLKPEVRLALLRIAHRFYSYLAVPVNIIDIIVTGSQANFTYTPQSDLDLHVILPFNEIECDQPVEELVDTKRKLWKENHNITIHGIPVECYAEDLDKPVTGSTYSLLQDRWVNWPKRIEFDMPQGVERITAAWTIYISSAIRDRDLDTLNNIKDMLKVYRKAGLDQEGEFGKANIVFKTLRNNGVIGMLINSIRQLEDQALSINQD